MVVNTALALLLGATGLVVLRLWRGPTLADRALALDLLGFVAVGLVALLAVRQDAPALFDAAMALALVAFLATVALARYAEEVERAVVPASRSEREARSRPTDGDREDRGRGSKGTDGRA